MTQKRNTDAPRPKKKRAKGSSGKSNAAQGQVSEKALRKERVSKGVKIALVALGCLAMVLSVTSMACSGFLSQRSSYHLTGGVAATVNDVQITEDTVTQDIMQVRSSYDSDEAWAQYLVDNGYTPASLREQVIQRYVQQALVDQAERENNISVSSDELEQAWQDAATSSGGEDALLAMVQAVGYDKDTYKSEILLPQLEEEKLQQAVAPVDVTDEEVVAYINENIDTYNDARRSSHILFAVNDDGSNDEEQKAAAQEVLDQINAGEISFEDAAEEHSDDGSGAEGGDVGWDCLTQFVTEYQTALDGLEKGQVSELVRSTYGYHIIKCTDYFHVDGQVASLDEVPDEIETYVRNILETQESQTAYSAWYAEYEAQATITINEMPEDVPYNVSLEGVTPSSTTDESSDEGSADEAASSGDGSSGSGDGAASEDSAS